jgi:tetratricopeptide (TPR) repeat protein
MKFTSRHSITICCLFLAANLFGQNPNNFLRGRVLYQSSGNKPAIGVRITEPDANGAYSTDNGDYQLKFQTKRAGDLLSLEIGNDDAKGQKLELVNEKEIKTARLPASPEEFLDIIVCPAGQRDAAALKYYRILRTTADRELEKKKKEVDGLLAGKNKDYQKISDLFAQLDQMQAALDSGKIREQAYSIASINIDRASQMVKDAVRKIEEDNDVEGALRLLNVGSLDSAYQRASALLKKADAAILQVVEGYEFKISLLEPQYKYSEIARCYEKIAEIYEKEDYDQEILAKYLASAASYWGQNGNYQKELDFGLKALTIREKVLSPEHPDLAQSYNNLAVVYNKLGEYEKALVLSQEALAIWEKVLAADHPDLAAAFNNLAVIYSNLGEYPKALESSLKSLDIREKTLPTDDPDLAKSYTNLAAIYSNLGDQHKALESNLKGLAIREKILSSEHPDLAKSYAHLAAIYGKLGQHQKSLEFNLKAINIQEKILPADHPDLALSYGSLAITYGNLGDQEKSMAFNLKSLTIREKTMSANHPDVATSYSSLATNYGKKGDIQKQLEYNLKALAIREKALPANHPDLAISYNNLAFTYSKLGEYQTSLEYNLKAVKIWELTLPANHPDLVKGYKNLATAYSNLGASQNQLDCSIKAAAILEKSLTVDSLDLALTYANIGRTCRDIADYAKGIEYSQKAILIGEALNPKPAFLNRFYIDIGITFLKANQFPNAKTALEKSENLKAEASVYRVWAMYFGLQNDKSRAIENLRKAVNLGYKDLNWIITDESMANIRSEQGYKEIVTQLQKQ